tara:strand:- start:11188 stop:11571 length:384 start_codon:yes stop_codon:yes gene_type:complete
MPTEAISEMRNTMSRGVDNSRANRTGETSKDVARQILSENEQSVPPAKDSSQPTSQELEQAAEELNKHVQNLKRDLHFSINDDTGETVIRVVDSESQKTIRMIPSEEFLSMTQQLNQTVGILLNAEA